MAVSVQFGGSSLVPAPMVSVNKEYTEGGDGSLLGSSFTITLNGVIVKPLDGTESDSSNLGDILAAQKSIRNTFSQTMGTSTTTGGGKTLSISHSGDTTQYVGCHVQSVDFDGGGPREVSLNQLGFYTVVLNCTDYTADNDTFTYNIQDASESWDMEYAEDIKDAVVNATGSSVTVKTAYRVSHTVSATGKPKYASASTLDTNGLAWQQAREYVLNILVLQGVNNSSLADGALTTTTLDIPSGLNNRNHVRSQSVDEKAGTFSVTETFLLYDSGTPANATEEIDVSASTRPSENGRTNVTISGTITGLRSGLTNTDDSYGNALSHFATIDSADSANFKSRADNLSGTSATLNPIPLSKSISKNAVAGTVTYSLEFDDRPVNCFTDALSDSVVISDTHPGYLFGSTPAIGRGIKGPVLQWLGCGTESKRSLTIEVVWPQETSYCNPAGSLPSLNASRASEIQTVISNSQPSAASGKIFHGPPRESWDPKNGRYTLEIEWTYEYSSLAIFTPQLT